jgi:hypothetical protein
MRRRSSLRIRLVLDRKVREMKTWSRFSILFFRSVTVVFKQPRAGNAKVVGSCFTYKRKSRNHTQVRQVQLLSIFFNLTRDAFEMIDKKSLGLP